MFTGLTRTLVIVTLGMVVLPGLVLWAGGGSEWTEKFNQFSPFF